MNPRAFIALVKETVAEWNEDKAPRLAAALAYYTVFSLAPVLIIVIAIAGLVFGQDAAQGEVVKQIDELVGKQGAEVIQSALQSAHESESSGPASIINLVILLFGASGVFAQLQDALNTVWEVAPKPGGALLTVLRQRFLSFAMLLVIGFLLLTSLVLSAGLAALGNFVGGLLPGIDLLWQILNFLVSFGVITVLFAAIYKILPDAKIAWDDVWIGAAITAFLFTVGKLLIGLYLGNASFGSTYGAAGSLVVILAWVFYSALILFFGAEFTQVYARRYGSRIIPSSHAVRLTKEDLATQGIPRNEDVKAVSQNQDLTAEERSAASARSRRSRQGGGLFGIVGSLKQRFQGSGRKKGRR